MRVEEKEKFAQRFRAEENEIIMADPGLLSPEVVESENAQRVSGREERGEL